MRWKMLWDLLTGQRADCANGQPVLEELARQQAHLEREVRALERAAALRKAEREAGWRAEQHGDH